MSLDKTIEGINSILPIVSYRNRDHDVPPIETTVKPDVKGRQETLSPTPQLSQTVRSAIELAGKDFEPSEQRILDKCGEVNFQLSNH